jgi:CheY-like chemotaxis protein
MEFNNNVLIFIAEDDPDDQELLKEAFTNLNPLYRVLFFGDGELLLNEIQTYSESEMPDLILLDLNMPRKGGLESLSELKRYKKYNNIPVVILSTSKNMDDETRSLSLGACDFVTKPVSFEGLMDAVGYITQTWIKNKSIVSERQ